MPSLDQFYNFFPKQTPPASALQQMRDRMEELTPSFGSGNVITDRGGAIIHGIDDPYGLPEEFWAEIVDPDSSEFNFSNEQYRLRPIFIQGAGINEQVETSLDPPSGELAVDDQGNISLVPPAQLTATNMAELTSHTHRLKVGDKVFVKRELDRGENPTWHYVFYGGISGESSYPAQITGVCDRIGGIYRGHMYVSPINITEADCFVSVGAPLRALNLPEGMTEQSEFLEILPDDAPADVVANPTEVFIIHTKENGLKTHWLKVGSWTIGVIRFYQVKDNDNKPTGEVIPVLLVSDGYAEDTGGSTLVSGGDAGSFVVLEPTDLWDRNLINNASGTDPEQIGDSPIGVYGITRWHNYPGSPGNCKDDPPKLILGMRPFQWDAQGHLLSIGPETIGEIVGCCPPQTTLASPSFASAAEADAARAMSSFAASFAAIG